MCVRVCGGDVSPRSANTMTTDSLCHCHHTACARRRATVPRHRWRPRRTANAAAAVATSERWLLLPRARHVRFVWFIIGHSCERTCHHDCHAALPRTQTKADSVRLVALCGPGWIYRITPSARSVPRLRFVFRPLSLAHDPTSTRPFVRSEPHNTARAGGSGSSGLKNTDKPPTNHTNPLG